MNNVKNGRIEIDQLHIHLGQGHDRFEALQDVAFNIEPGEFVCILGPSGCGKSTFIRCLNRLHEEIPNSKVQGEVLYHGLNIYEQ